MTFCPAGLDCGVLSACPEPIVPCPPGFLCGYFGGQPFAQTISDALGEAAINGNYTEAQCVGGFQCQGNSSISACADGEYCPAGAQTAIACNPFDVCFAEYALAFPTLLVAAALSFLVAAASLWLNHTQRRAARHSRSSAGRFQAALVPEVQLERRAVGAGIAVRNLRVSLPASGQGVRTKFLLDGVSFDIAPEALTVILGPSGSGKSTLLAALRHRIVGATVSGDILWSENGSSGRVAPRVAFVPKEDVLDRELTARELFTFSAQLRLPPSVQASAVRDAVERTLSALKLQSVADTVVGGSANSPANISGGQLKRVSIGIELVAAPRVLLLDEPTGGLDATSALQLMSNLQAITRSRGVTVLAALHQPRVEVWDLCDGLAVLAAGGRLAYAGPPSGFTRFVSGAAPSPGMRALGGLENPADYAVDVAAGRILASGCTAPAASIARLVEAWRQEAAVSRCAPGAASWEIVAGSGAAAAASKEEVAATAAEAEPAIASVPRQLALQTRRACLVRLRDGRRLLLYLALHVFLAAALSAGFSPLVQSSGYVGADIGYLPPVSAPLQRFCPPFLARACATDISNEGLLQMMFFVTVACGAASGIAAVQLFSEHAGGGALARESGWGASTAAYGAARMAADLPVVAWNAAVFCAVWAAFGAAGSPWRWLAIYGGIAFAASGVGYLAALLSSAANASMTVTVVVLTTAVFSGTNPPLAVVRALPVVCWAWYASFGLWVAQAVYSTYTAFEAGVRPVAAAARGGLGFDADAFAASIAAVFCIGLAWRGAALAVLASRHSPRCHCRSR